MLKQQFISEICCWVICSSKITSNGCKEYKNEIINTHIYDIPVLCSMFAKTNGGDKAVK